MFLKQAITVFSLGFILPDLTLIFTPSIYTPWKPFPTTIAECHIPLKIVHSSRLYGGHETLCLCTRQTQIHTVEQVMEGKIVFVIELHIFKYPTIPVYKAIA